MIYFFCHFYYRTIMGNSLSFVNENFIFFVETIFEKLNK